jgi:hypothetical protein
MKLKIRRVWGSRVWVFVCGMDSAPGLDVLPPGEVWLWCDFVGRACGYPSEVRCKTTASMALTAVVVVLQRSSMRSCVPWHDTEHLVFLCPKPPTSYTSVRLCAAKYHYLPGRPPTYAYLPCLPPPVPPYLWTPQRLTRYLYLCPTIAHYFTHYRGGDRKGI